MHCNRLVEKIKHIASVSELSIQMLCENSSVKKLGRGQILLHEGAVCRNIYFIESGHLRTYYVKEGREINLNFSFESNFVTNIKSFFAETPSENFIKAGEPTTVITFKKEQLLLLYDRAIEIESLGRRLMELSLLKQEEHSNLFKLYNPAERYHYVAKYHPHLLQRVSLSQLASYIGISRETISRIRKGSHFFVEA